MYPSALPFVEGSCISVSCLSLSLPCLRDCSAAAASQPPSLGMSPVQPRVHWRVALVLRFSRLLCCRLVVAAWWRSSLEGCERDLLRLLVFAGPLDSRVFFLRLPLGGRGSRAVSCTSSNWVEECACFLPCCACGWLGAFAFSRRMCQRAGSVEGSFRRSRWRAARLIKFSRVPFAGSCVLLRFAKIVPVGGDCCAGFLAEHLPGSFMFHPAHEWLGTGGVLVETAAGLQGFLQIEQQLEGNVHASFDSVLAAGHGCTPCFPECADGRKVSNLSSADSAGSWQGVSAFSRTSSLRASWKLLFSRKSCLLAKAAPRWAEVARPLADRAAGFKRSATFPSFCACGWP